MTDVSILLQGIIALTAVLSFLLLGFNALLSHLKAGIARLESNQGRLESNQERLEAGQGRLESKLDIILSDHTNPKTKVNEPKT